MLRMWDAKYNGELRLEEGGTGFTQLKKVMVTKRVISACARVTNLLEVVMGPFGLPGESLQVPTCNACGTAETPDSG